jgi:hypothetical protein
VPRTVWLALICLISLGIFFALRSNIGARPVQGETSSVLVPSPDLPIDDRPPLAKADRLPSRYFDSTAAKSADDVQVFPTVTEAATTPNTKQDGDLAPQAKSDPNEVTTWHWHLGSKTTKRTTVVGPRDSRKAD